MGGVLPTNNSMELYCCARVQQTNITCVLAFGRDYQHLRQHCPRAVQPLLSQNIKENQCHKTGVSQYAKGSGAAKRYARGLMCWASTGNNIYWSPDIINFGRAFYYVYSGIKKPGKT